MAEDTEAQLRPIVTHREAIVRGLKRYFTGKPCKHGHISERVVGRSSCLKCASEATKRGLLRIKGHNVPHLEQRSNERAHAPTGVYYLGAISRASDAKSSGDKKYFTGKACKYGHVSQRFVCNNRCVVCSDEYTQYWNKTEKGVKYISQYKAGYSDRKKTERAKRAATLVGWMKRKIDSIRQGAVSRRLEFDICAEDLVSLYTNQEGKCAVTGIVMRKSTKTGPFTLSVDRIDDTKGYTPNNIRLVIWWYNAVRFKGMTDQDVLKMCRAVVSAHKSKREPKNNADHQMQLICEPVRAA